MEIFDAEWLALREAADRRARDGTLPERLSAAWRRRGWSRVVDLGSGTGANLRYLAPRLPAGQRWTLVDHDPRHVDRLQRLEAPPGVDALAAVSRDLAADGLAVVEGCGPGDRVGPAGSGLRVVARGTGEQVRRYRVRRVLRADRRRPRAVDDGIGGRVAGRRRRR